MAKDFAILCRAGGAMAEDLATLRCANGGVAEDFAVLCRIGGAMAKVVWRANEGVAKASTRVTGGYPSNSSFLVRNRECRRTARA